MDRQQAFDMVKSDLIEIFEIEEETITPEATLMDDLGLDSIDGVDMMVRMQERTGKKVTPDQFEDVRTISDLVDLVLVLHA
jgi:acyl carrier protein